MTDEQNDLVERLGNFAETWHRLYGMNTKVMDEAADEIERLRAEIRTLRTDKVQRTCYAAMDNQYCACCDGETI